MKALGQRYAQYANRVHGRTGSLREGRFRSCLTQEESCLLACQRYIELNPIHTGMVDDPADYPWSSYRVNALGDSAFGEEIARALGKRTTLDKSGRPRKPVDPISGDLI